MPADRQCSLYPATVDSSSFARTYEPETFTAQTIYSRPSHGWLISRSLPHGSDKDSNQATILYQSSKVANPPSPLSNHAALTRATTAASERDRPAPLAASKCWGHRAKRENTLTRGLVAGAWCAVSKLGSRPTSMKTVGGEGASSLRRRDLALTPEGQRIYSWGERKAIQRIGFVETVPIPATF